MYIYKITIFFLKLDAYKNMQTFVNLCKNYYLKPKL